MNNFAHVVQGGTNDAKLHIVNRHNNGPLPDDAQASFFPWRADVHAVSGIK
ncbi:hypothetical protein P6293_004634 [Salmonella enterica]|uniref:Uncharacterized protein n=1 Tax=Escherichia coli TaxID=562 RepID=A0A6G2B5G3_ECOLX|nr:hypothetical protein [Escherichia coli]EEB6540743.1 hypothetical protein [Salmonella enterica subsp. enterica serovar Alachua]EGJ5193280.1 hypothetical protein [Salmonella enterica]EJY4061156.1 hypothetical protein [Salmonella enterica subsp. enterica]EFJ2475899.1 hypothetical protein [Escherichia coli]EFJ2542955.1 hypothetical protein [Escherichia coli]